MPSSFATMSSTNQCQCPLGASLVLVTATFAHCECSTNQYISQYSPFTCSSYICPKYAVSNVSSNCECQPGFFQLQHSPLICVQACPVDTSAKLNVCICNEPFALNAISSTPTFCSNKLCSDEHAYFITEFYYASSE